MELVCDAAPEQKSCQYMVAKTIDWVDCRSKRAAADKTLRFESRNVLIRRYCDIVSATTRDISREW
jgi:hypothetical protein